MVGPKHKDFELKHVNELLSNLNDELQEIEGRSLQGMIYAAMHVFDDMDRTEPRIPVDLGNLRLSFFILTTKGGGDQHPEKPKGEMAAEHQRTVSTVQGALMALRRPTVAMGFSANYAVYVHENLHAKFDRPKRIGGKMKKPRAGGGPRFFSAALARNHNRIIEIIAEEAKI